MSGIQPSRSHHLAHLAHFLDITQKLKMPMYVTGYYLQFKTVHVIMDALQIPDRGVEEERLEYPINNWLAENNHLHVRAGAIAHPTRAASKQEDGILLMTRFIEANRDDPTISHVKEDKRDLRVRDWLVEAGGVQPEALDWMGPWDNFYLTRTGIMPERNDVQGHQRPRRVLSATLEDLKGWNKTLRSGIKMDLIDYLLQKEEKLDSAAKSTQPLQ